MTTPFSARFLDLKRHEVQRKSHWKMSIEGIEEDIMLHARTTALLERQFEVINTKYFNDQVKQAGSRSFTDIPIELHDAVGPDVERKFNEWQEMILNTDTGRMGYAQDYKRTARITEYGLNSEVRAIWQLEGVWPSSCRFGELAMDDGSKKSINVTLTYDRGNLMPL